MKQKYYPWGGEFVECDPKSSVAVVLLDIHYEPTDKVAIYGNLKTENIGIEKIVANVISNPYIRYLVVCGNEIRGHRSGESLIALNKNGIDDKNRIIEAPGAIPYIENIDKKAIERFQKQIEIIDFLNVTDKKIIDKKIISLLDKKTKPLDKPYIAIKIEQNKTEIHDKRAIHSKIVVDYIGKIKKRGK
jgi:tetrahydromethanopterin S-methyltransferase subunit A